MSNTSSNISGNNNTLSIILGTTFAVGTITSLGWYYYYFTIRNDCQQNDLSRSQQERRASSSKSRYTSSSKYPQKLKPPFPQEIRNMLSKCHLAYLSTIDQNESSSHLSLMRFTYLNDSKDGEIVIMSTNTGTKKFDMLIKQKGVALLVHDFNNGNDVGMYSITLNGNCRIIPTGSKDDIKYRNAHLQHNPEYPQFIIGQDIVILCIDITSARICDIQDQVIQWNINDGLIKNKK